MVSSRQRRADRIATLAAEHEARQGVEEVLEVVEEKAKKASKPKKKKLTDIFKKNK